MDSLVNFLLNLNMSNDEVFRFVSHVKCIELKKNEHFQLQGYPSKYMGYVDSGKFRYYKTDKEGNERTLWFNREFPLIGDYHSFLRRTDAELSIQAMDHYEIVLFTYGQLMELFNMNVNTQRFRAMVAERSMFGWRDIALALHFDSAEERYMKLVGNYPDIEKEISLKHIASCLGITPETLSRIRKKTAKSR